MPTIYFALYYVDFIDQKKIWFSFGSAQNELFQDVVDDMPSHICDFGKMIK